MFYAPAVVADRLRQPDQHFPVRGDVIDQHHVGALRHLTLQRVAKADRFDPGPDDDQPEIQPLGYLVGKQYVPFLGDRHVRRFFARTALADVVRDESGYYCPQRRIGARRKQVKKNTRFHFIQSAERNSACAAHKNKPGNHPKYCVRALGVADPAGEKAARRTVIDAHDAPA